MPNTPEVSMSENWLSDVYFPSLSQEKAAALDQLHNATNWGLTLATTALVIVLSREQFPDMFSLYTLLITFIIANHFFTRTLKGYINVIRWSLIQREIMTLHLQSEVIDKAVAENQLKELINKYHIKWHLPLKRRDVFIKGLFELGYGYILVGILGVTIYVINTISIQTFDLVFIVISVVIAIFEHFLLIRSPYMRNILINESARNQK